MRLLQSVLSSDPDERDMPAPWAARPRPASTALQTQAEANRNLADLPAKAYRTALGLSFEAAGMPSALLRTITAGVRTETSALSLTAPRMANRKSTRRNSS